MKAQRLYQPAPVENNPLQLEDAPRPEPSSGELLVRVNACGICHTDLHLVEGELPDPALPVIPGHQIVGEIVGIGSEVTQHKIGTRVGIPWLHWADGTCQFCQSDHENLCEKALFTGYTAQGGYAEYVTVPEDFAVTLPEGFSDLEAAPLLCAGIVGYRSLRLSDLQPGEKLGIYGFGSSGLICLQVARYWGCEVYVFTRGEAHQRQALELGAVWAGRPKQGVFGKFGVGIGIENGRKMQEGDIFPAALGGMDSLGIQRRVLAGIGSRNEKNQSYRSEQGYPPHHYRLLYQKIVKESLTLRLVYGPGAKRAFGVKLRQGFL